MNKDAWIALALAVLISGGLLALIAGQLPQTPIRIDAPASPEPSASGNAALEVAPPTATPALTPPAQTLSIEQLRAACVEEVKRPADDPRRRWACAGYEQATQGISAAAPRPSPTVSAFGSSGTAKTYDDPPSQRPAAPTERSLADHCGHHAYGTIPYRKCRAHEKERLVELCRRATANAEATLGPTRQQMKEIARNHCRTAELYRIVN